MAESIQRILKRRDGQHATRPEEIIAWLEAAARGWNREPRRSSGVANARPDEHGLARAAKVSADQRADERLSPEVSRWGSLRDLLITVHLAGDHGLHVGLNPYLVQQVAKVLAIGPPSTTLPIVLVIRVAPNSASTRRNAS